MRKSLALAALITLSACQSDGTLVTPISVADKTTLDEKAGIAAETLYTAASKVGLNLVTAGTITQAQYRVLDNAAYTALLATRAAYRAGNSVDYATAAGQVTVAAYAIFALVKGNKA